MEAAQTFSLHGDEVDATLVPAMSQEDAIQLHREVAALTQAVKGMEVILEGGLRELREGQREIHAAGLVHRMAALEHEVETLRNQIVQRMLAAGGGGVISGGALLAILQQLLGG